MPTLAGLADRLHLHPDLYSSISFRQLTVFFEVITRLLPSIQLSVRRKNASLPPLPQPIQHLLSLELCLSIEDVNNLWAAFGQDLVFSEIDPSSSALSNLVSQIDQDFKDTHETLQLGSQSYSFDVDVAFR